MVEPKPLNWKEKYSDDEAVFITLYELAGAVDWLKREIGEDYENLKIRDLLSYLDDKIDEAFNIGD